VVAQRPPVGSSTSETISLTVPAGMPIQVVIDEEVKIERVGQPIHLPTLHRAGPRRRLSKEHRDGNWNRLAPFWIGGRETC
jgi:hypothetical protein